MGKLTYQFPLDLNLEGQGQEGREQATLSRLQSLLVFIGRPDCRQTNTLLQLQKEEDPLISKHFTIRNISSSLKWFFSEIISFCCQIESTYLLADVAIPRPVPVKRVVLNPLLPLYRIQKGTMHFQELFCVSALTFFSICRLNFLVIDIMWSKI